MALEYRELFWLMESDTDLYRKEVVAVFKAATDIIVEDPQTANHANRVAWAQAALLDPKAKANEMRLSVLQNATIQTLGDASTDNDVQFVVNSLVNSFATGG